ncbi:hypothetical protein C8D92_104189 [Tamilnaduibacter salinus]|uniref:DUF6316 domain-containing protein n=1 Tax=Tamilnaduibacter salinus TaxID=1484056 RepID=A0A2A2I1G3_9GAMM|nr:DUF6316 family protein [Tamilnaduibacter salinus]PAV25442.1 hypothetical protein CF392_11045 [Tamilnaduibacter salinus]PVY76957.1 hypothetical protein C8D92_104189 [Tamilnaduibacter salinus]
MDVRQGESEKNWFRSDRFSCVNGEWFFETREGAIEGPFGSQREAENALLLYLRHVEDDLVSRQMAADSGE